MELVIDVGSNVSIDGLEGIFLISGQVSISSIGRSCVVMIHLYFRTPEDKINATNYYFLFKRFINGLVKIK